MGAAEASGPQPALRGLIAERRGDMYEATLEQVAEAARGRVLQEAPGDLVVRGVTTDSRQTAPGQLFVALAGENFDGHDYVEAAREAGAAAAVVARPCPSPIAQVEVADTLAALGFLACWWRDQRPEAVVIGVTGSTGKTTTKGLLAAVLATQAPTLFTPGSENAEIGVPRTLLKLGDERFCVLEMAMRGRGQIAQLAAIAQPQVGVITNVGEAHIGLPGLGTREQLADAKAELLAALPEDGVAVLKAEDFFYPVLAEIAGERRVVSFGLERGDFTARDVRRTEGGTGFTMVSPAGEAEVALALPGSHNVLNALAAAAAAWAVGVGTGDIAAALGEYRGERGRSQVYRRRDGTDIIDDCYNANPSSVAAALELLADAPGRRIFVFGDMLELGDLAEEAHRRVGLAAVEAGVDAMVAVGELGRLAGDVAAEAGVEVLYAADAAEAARLAPSVVRTRDRVLVKASHALDLTPVVEALVEEAANGGE